MDLDAPPLIFGVEEPKEEVNRNRLISLNAVIPPQSYHYSPKDLPSAPSSPEPIPHKSDASHSLTMTPALPSPAQGNSPARLKSSKVLLSGEEGQSRPRLGLRGPMRNMSDVMT